ncbi:28 kDa ribonucleoprotein, chloroplastic-like [Ipomoea triloba]|uniref:28 kDa ribonucleoprotein, chloroplastic-like n=1 Tax=Ipomoea triloba TaxID=35885 RepID=UPI00125DBBEE|nr:28 kDa ribonucleoprotein, chloroplastic-like [Ipomoea triloba]XP_031098752.1 28 kDa ribonucleoprotein, chloroplastic-like [Ipomoea triloba]
MAATAMASSFSTSMQTLKCTRPKLLTLVKSIKTSQQLQSHFLGIESCLLTSKRRAHRLAAAVAQEEAAVTDTPPVVPDEEEESGGDDQSSGVNCKLYFGNLPYNCDSAQLAGIVQDYGSPELVEVLYDRETGKSRGFAFVTMSCVEDCNAVIENLDGRVFGGRTLRVNFSDKPKAKEPLYPETEYKLFVGNLAWSVTSEMLTEMFEAYGSVVGARVLYDGETGRSRGYGFVSYETREEMENAITSLNGVELEGRAMRISQAQGKKQ